MPANENCQSRRCSKGRRPGGETLEKGGIGPEERKGEVLQGVLPNVLSKSTLNKQVMDVLRGSSTKNTNPRTLPTFSLKVLPGEEFISSTEPKK
jgi:hypothetical protein